MDVDGFVTALEKYLREFITHLMRFFRPSVDDEVYDDQEGYNKSVLFALFATAFGAYLWGRYIEGKKNKDIDIFGVMVDNLLEWISLGIVLFLVIRLFRMHAPIVKTAISVLKVFSVAHVVSIYAAYLSVNLIWFYRSEECYRLLAPTWSPTFAFAIQLALVLAYIPREVRELVGDDTARWRRIGVNALYLTLVAILVLTPIAVLQNQERASLEGCTLL